MKTKILITIEGGNLQSIHSTEEIDIVLVDFDNIENQTEIELDVLSPDNIVNSGKFYQLFSEKDNPESDIRDELKRIKY